MQELTLLSPTPSRTGIRAAILIFGLVSITLLGLYSFDVSFPSINISSISNFIHSLGPWGPIAYIMILILSVVISQIPGAPLVILAGTIWSPFWAAILTIVGGFIGALLAYALGRQLGAPFIQKITGKTFQFESSQNQRRLGGMIFLSRLFPVIPFDLLSYGAGVSQVSLPLYTTATLFGMIPSTFLLAYGTTIDLSSISTALYSHL